MEWPALRAGGFDPDCRPRRIVKMAKQENKMSGTDEEVSSAITLIPHPKLYPYLVTRIVPGLYHLMIIPGVSNDPLIKIATVQQMLNDLPTCLVSGDNLSLFIDNEIGKLSKEAPSGGFVVADKLIPCFDVSECIEEDPTFMPRVEALRVFTESQKKEGFMSGDLTKGGRPATTDERDKLGGPNPKYEGVPNGLARCTDCNEFRGVCLDPSPNFKGQLMTVHCRCENKNKCARCLESLSSRKLGANYYNVEDGQIWHCPAFVAFSHVCRASESRHSLVRASMMATS